MDARFNEIQTTILTARNEVESLNALEVLTQEEQSVLGATSTSKVGQWRLWIWIFSFALWLLEKTIIQNSKNTKEQNVPTLKETILNYHDGLELKWLDNTWGYDFTGVTDPDSLKLIKQCAIIRPSIGGLIFKIVGESGPVSGDVLNRFKDYCEKKCVPGIPIDFINSEADQLYIDYTVYVDSNIIDLSTGRLINSTDDVYPVLDAISNYLKNLEFNGAFVKAFFEKELESVNGVYVPQMNELKWKYSGFPFIEFGPFKIPESGWFQALPENINITYLSDALVYS